MSALSGRGAARRGWAIVRRALFYVALGYILLTALFPFAWAILTSIRSGSEIFSTHFIPTAPTLDNYRGVLEDQSFLTSIVNSVIVATTTVVVSLLLSVFAAYPLSRLSFRGRSLILLTILSVSMFPQIAVLSGLFVLIRWLGLYNNQLGLALGYLVLVLPFTIWVLRGFMKALPKELEEAAILDGLSPVGILFRVFFPLLKPAIATTAILGFIAAWNEFLFALTFTLTSDKRTVPVAIAMLSGASQFELPWGNIMAASVIVTLPLIAIVLIFQKQIVSGLTSGAVKG